MTGPRRTRWTCGWSYNRVVSRHLPGMTLRCPGCYRRVTVVTSDVGWPVLEWHNYPTKRERAQMRREASSRA